MNGKKYSIEKHGPKIEAFLNRLLGLTGFQVSYDITDQDIPHADVQEMDLRVRFTGEEVDLLLANRAELLLALEHLTHEALRLPNEDHSRIGFDANDHRILRIEELRSSALSAADRVKQSGLPFRFNPMNSRERRILHIALRGEPAVRSESEGEEPRRIVVIYPAGMPSRPQSTARPPMRRRR